jgi:hypothetical protein
VHFAGALTQFVIDQYLRKQPFPAVEEAQPSTEEQFDEEPDDIPF